MTAPDLLAPIRERADKATEGPWRWENTLPRPRLAGSGGWTVMDFARMGMNGAQPTFRKADGDLVKAGKENLYSFPDAALIANAPTDIRRLLAALDGVLALHEQVDALMNPGRHERVVKVCTGCGTDDGNWQRYPCPTVAAVVAALQEGHK
ncbi:hypothetical protein AB4Z38_06965 [Arthrobacter sp. 2RAF6]|uniref:hypothetical protein n=1 Tax=Arthrobacter sp. 2RAF6 TaxID=3233002 RepID=UPI003F9238BF